MGRCRGSLCVILFDANMMPRSGRELYQVHEVWVIAPRTPGAKGEPSPEGGAQPRRAGGRMSGIK